MTTRDPLRSLGEALYVLLFLIILAVALAVREPFKRDPIIVPVAQPFCFAYGALGVDEGFPLCIDNHVRSI